MRKKVCQSAGWSIDTEWYDIKIYFVIGPFMMYYFSVVILLNRPCINNGKHENEDDSAQRCTEAAKAIIDVARFVCNDDIMHFGHTAGMFRILRT